MSTMAPGEQLPRMLHTPFSLPGRMLSGSAGGGRGSVGLRQLASSAVVANRNTRLRQMCRTPFRRLGSLIGATIPTTLVARVVPKRKVWKIGSHEGCCANQVGALAYGSSPRLSAPMTVSETRPAGRVAMSTSGPRVTSAAKSKSLDCVISTSMSCPGLGKTASCSVPVK